MFGPPGTAWGPFSADRVLDRVAPGGGSSWPDRLVKLLRKIGFRWVNGSGHWVVPFTVQPSGELMRWARVTVHGKIGTVEEVAHTFTLRTQPTPDAEVDAAAIKTLANRLRDQWVTFLATPGAGGGPAISTYLSTELVYDEVRVAYLEQLAPGARQPDGRVILPRPAYIIPTQYAAFAAGTVKGSGSPSLPYEVAMAVTLNTNQRGASARGRVYLGPFSNGIMNSAGGLFDRTRATQFGSALGTNFIDAINGTGGWQFQVVSRTHLGASPIQGTRVGVVPDSQRRRRRSQPEVSVQTWGQGIGAV